MRVWFGLFVIPALFLPVSCAVVNETLKELAWRACPPDEPYVRWVLHGASCTTLVPNLWIPGTTPIGNAHCKDPQWRFGSSSSKTVLWNISDAMSVGSSVSSNSSTGGRLSAAWVGLQTVSSINDTVYTWQWEQPQSQYALADGSAWIDGFVPAPVPDSCAVVHPSGLLQSLPCQPSAINDTSFQVAFAACSIPSCTCEDESSCRTATPLGFWDGYSCAILDGSTPHITGIGVLHHEGGQDDAAGAALGCGTAVNTTAALDGILQDLSLLPGDVLRVCGNFPQGRNDKWRLRAAGPGMWFDDEGGVLPRRLQGAQSGTAPLPCTGMALPLSSCMEFRLPWSTFSRPLGGAGTVADGISHTCAITAAPAGAVRCYVGFTDAVDDNPLPPENLPYATAIASNGRDLCAITAGAGEQAGAGRVTCWGPTAEATNIPLDVFGAAQVAVTMESNSGCALALSGDLRCWGANAQTLSGVASIESGGEHTCAVLAGTGKVQCWGDQLQPEDGVPTDLPRVHSLAASKYTTCAILEGSGLVRCWGKYLTLVPMDLGPVISLSMERQLSKACAVRAQDGQLRCWTEGTAGDDDDAVQAILPVTLPDAIRNGTWLTVYHAYSVIHVQGKDMRQLQGSDGNMQGHYLAGFSSSRRLRLPPWPGLHLDSPLSPLPARLGTLTFSWPMYIHRTAVMVLSRVEWLDDCARGSACTIRLHRVRRPVPAGLSDHVLASLTGNTALSVPVVRLHAQDPASSRADIIQCESLDFQSAFTIDCSSSAFFYGATVEQWNGTASLYTAVGRDRPPIIYSTTVKPNVAYSRLLAPAVNLSEVREGMLSSSSVRQLWAAANVSAPQPGVGEAESVRVGNSSIVAVRPGDVVELQGVGFGANPVTIQSVPWSPKLRVARSCIHLAWWASPTAYHGPTACVCNGQEDWPGEGELPLARIQSWNDTVIRFTAPAVEGVREIRLCVEERASAIPPVSALSSFLVWEPVTLTAIRPYQFSESTESDTPVDLETAVTALPGATQSPSSSPLWMDCATANRSQSDLQVAGSTMGGGAAAWIPEDSERYMGGYRRCTSAIIVRTTFGACYMPEGSGVEHWPVPLQQEVRACLPVLRFSTSSSASPNGQATETNLLHSVPIPDGVPNAVLQLGFSIEVWDGGTVIRAGSPPLTFTRTTPVLRAFRPNPLLLGPVGTGTAPAILTLFGPGFRTADEIRNPRNGFSGLYSISPYPVVWVDGVECANTSAIRTDGGFASVECIFPAGEVAGGFHEVTMQMAGYNTTLDSSVATSVALFSECAAGYFGLFPQPTTGHGPTDTQGQRKERPPCLRCPDGASCPQGVAVAPISLAGHFNLGLLETAACPPLVAASVAGIRQACVVACSPQEACVGANQCAEGYVSAHPEYRCARCANGYYRSVGVCVPCPQLGILPLIILLLSCAFAALIGQILSKANIDIAPITLMVDYMQLVSIFSGPSVPLPGTLQQFLRTLSFIRFNLETVAPECWNTAFGQPEAKLWAVILAPLALVCMAVAVSLAIRVVQWIRGPARSTRDYGPRITRTTLSLLGLLYLPVVQTGLEFWNCTPVQPPDGFTYLRVTFEACEARGGLKDRLQGWAALALVIYGLGYPAAVAVFFARYSDRIVEDQLLRAAHTGDEASSNPRAYRLRVYTSTLYKDYKPGRHWALLAAQARRALICICALLLNQSSILLASSVVFVLVPSLVVNAVWQPYMTPGVGYVVTLARFAAAVRTGQSKEDKQMHSRLQEIASRGSAPLLRDVLAGKARCSDMELARTPWWRAIFLDYNVLEAQLQLHIVLTGLLCIMYNAAQRSVYEATATPAVTSIFLLSQLCCLSHLTLACSMQYAPQVWEMVKDRVPDRAIKAVAGCAGIASSALVGAVGNLASCCLRQSAHAGPGGLKQAGGGDSSTLSEWSSNPLSAPSKSSRDDRMRRVEEVLRSSSMVPSRGDAKYAPAAPAAGADACAASGTVEDMLTKGLAALARLDAALQARAGSPGSRLSCRVAVQDVTSPVEGVEGRCDDNCCHDLEYDKSEGEGVRGREEGERELLQEALRCMQGIQLALGTGMV